MVVIFRRNSPLRIAFLCFVLAALIAVGTSAQSRPSDSDFDPSPIIKLLTTADGKQASAILEKITIPHVPAFIAAFEPNDLREDAHDEILQQVGELVRRARTARVAADKTAEADWDSRTGLAIYKSAGLHNPAWDNLAIDALTTNSTTSREERRKKFKAAVDAGCPDPLVRYYNIRCGLLTKAILPEAALTEYLAILSELEKSAYTPVRTFWLRAQIVQLCLNDLAKSPANYEIASQQWAAAIKMLPTLAEEHGGPILLKDAVEILRSAGQKLGHSSKSDFDQIHPHLALLFPDSALPYDFAADFYVSWAWEGAERITQTQFRTKIGKNFASGLCLPKPPRLPAHHWTLWTSDAQRG